jgi:hypothetical protein
LYTPSFENEGNELLYEALRMRQKPEILHSDFGSKVSGEGFDPLPRLGESLLCSAVSKYLGHFPEALLSFISSSMPHKETQTPLLPINAGSNQPIELPLEVQAFLMWVILWKWRGDSSG